MLVCLPAVGIGVLHNAVWIPWHKRILTREALKWVFDEIQCPFFLFRHFVCTTCIYLLYARLCNLAVVLDFKRPTPSSAILIPWPLSPKEVVRSNISVYGCNIGHFESVFEYEINHSRAFLRLLTCLTLGLPNSSLNLFFKTRCPDSDCALVVFNPIKGSLSWRKMHSELMGTSNSRNLLQLTASHCLLLTAFSRQTALFIRKINSTFTGLALTWRDMEQVGVSS